MPGIICEQRCQNTTFLDLPREIRDLIYQFALVKPSPVDLASSVYLTASQLERRKPSVRPKLDKWLSASVPFERRPGKRPIFRLLEDLCYIRQDLTPALLRTNWQVRYEALRIFYGRNIWRFSEDVDWATLYRFLQTISDDAKALIRRIEVCVPGICDSNMKNIPDKDCVNIPPLDMERCTLRRVFMGAAVRDMLSRVHNWHCLNMIVADGLEWFPWIELDVRRLRPAGLKFTIEPGGRMSYGPQYLKRTDWTINACAGSLITERLPAGYSSMLEPMPDGSRCFRPVPQEEVFDGLERLFAEERSSRGRKQEKRPVTWVEASIPSYRWA